MVRFGTPGQNINGLAYADSRLANVPTIQAPRRPLVTDKKFPLQTVWRVSASPSTGSEGEEWILVKFESNGDATWQRFQFSASGGDGIDSVTTDDTTVVLPDGANNINVAGDASQGVVTSGS